MIFKFIFSPKVSYLIMVLPPMYLCNTSGILILLSDESFATVEIASGVVVKVQKQGINQKMPKGSTKS
jgi:hypothetical protein